MTPTTLDLQRHALDLATAFDVRLIVDARLKPEEALGLPRIRVALCSTIIDETTYAVALHEIGHLAAPAGVVRQAATSANSALMIVEEDAAWAWAKHYALVWSPAMQFVMDYAMGTYERHDAQQRQRSTPPPAPTPVAPLKPSIDWKKWK